MSHPHTQEIFTTKRLLRIARELNPGMNIDNDRLRDWGRRQLLAGKPGSPGVERRYTFEEMVQVLVFSLLTDYIRRLEEVPAAAAYVAQFIVSTYGDGDEAGVPVLLLRDAETPEFELQDRSQQFGDVARLSPWRPALVLDPVGIALELYRAVSGAQAA